MTPPVAYFAYGSNMDPATLGGRRGIAWTRAVPALARGWRLALDKPSLLGTGEGMATIVRDDRAEVWGVLYEISAEDFEHLELTEGVRLGHYERVSLLVEPSAARDDAVPSPVPAFTLASDRREVGVRPTARYVGLLVAGATAHGLPEGWIAMLQAIVTAGESADAAAMRPVIDAAMKNLR